MPLNSHERDLIARTMLGEAGNQGDQGLAAVAAVIKNRATGNDPNFPRDITGVVHQRNAFSAWSQPSTPKYTNPRDYRNDDPQLAHASQIADKIFSGDMDDPTGGATYFANVPYTQKVLGNNPSFFKYPQTAQIGEHTFFSPKPPQPVSIASIVGPSPIDKKDQIGSLINSFIGPSPLDNQ